MHTRLPRCSTQESRVEVEGTRFGAKLGGGRVGIHRQELPQLLRIVMDC